MLSMEGSATCTITIDWEIQQRINRFWIRSFGLQPKLISVPVREFPRKKEVKICELLLTNLSGFLDLLIEVGALSHHL